MVSLKSSDKNFGHLSQELQLIVTDYLPYVYKIKLVDIFEPIISQIDTFDTTLFNVPDGSSVVETENGVKLFQKLTRVKKVLFPRWPKKVDKLLLSTISKSNNKNIKSFIFKYRPRYSDNYDHCVLDYIKNVCKSDSSYDARHIDYAFRIDNGVKLLDDHPDLKLKLRFLAASVSDKNFLTDSKIRDMITEVEVNEHCHSYEDNVDEDDPLNGFVLPSVEHVLYCFFYH